MHREDEPTSRLRTQARILGFVIFVPASIRLFLSLNLPLQFFYFAPMDDGLFMRLATNLASGRWLGNFDQHTLMKGPGYPVFLALTSFSGLSLSAAHGLFQITAILITGWALWRLSASATLGALATTVLMLYPDGLMPGMQRVFRDQIYWAQVLLVVSLFSVAFLDASITRKFRLTLAGIAGFVLGWTWLTREEGIWLLPGLITLVGCAVFLGPKNEKEFSGVWQSAIVMGMVFLAVNAGFRLGNWIAYGSFVGVDMKESSFVAALNALQSINAGPIEAYVPVPAVARAKAAEFSPTFRPLAAKLAPGSALAAQYQVGCTIYKIKQSCGDIAAGWFIWALRDAAAESGFYDSPKIAAEKFRQIADDIQAACGEKKLRCRRTWVSYMPAMTQAQWLALPRFSMAVIKRIAFLDSPVSPIPPLHIDVEHATFEWYWRFLNYPKISRQTQDEAIAYGWYYDSRSDEWPSFKVNSENGEEMPSLLVREASPDLQHAFSDDKANTNRWEISFLCPKRCILLALRDGKPSLRLPLVPDHPASVSSGTATLYLDEATHKYSTVNFGEQAALFIRNSLVLIYGILAPSLVILGVVTGIAAGMHRCIGNPSKGVPTLLLWALAGWILVASRTVLLALMDASTGSPVNFAYTAPANYLAILAAILSISAFLKELAADIPSVLAFLGFERDKLHRW